jgi:polyribonucleotide nucleotidyltransferase
MEKSYTIKTPNGDITLSTGKVAKLSAGAVMVQKGGTVLLATADVDPNPAKGDFLPLTVEYLERYYATGVMSGSRFNKRESNPSAHAITIARQIDHTIRPLFPKDFVQPVNVILTLLANDGVNNPEDLTVLAASAALGISGIPFAGPAASVVLAVKEDGSIALNPTVAELEDHSMVGEFILAGNEAKLLNFEGWGKEIPNTKMDEVIDTAMEYIQMLCREQHTFATDISKPLMQYTGSELPQALIDQMYAEDQAEITKYWYMPERKELGNALKLELLNYLNNKYITAENGVEESQVKVAMEYVAKKMMRQNIVKEGKRFSNRGLEEIRPLSASIDILPTVHGSAMFNRGLTQSLSIVTLGSTAKGRGFDDMADEDTNQAFMHHYNFPPFSTGEAGRVRYRPGRREIGHGAIGENALMHMVPSQDEFPYTIRVVSEIMTSNGSTSMAATCASSMALMAAGVPMKAAVAGIGVGLIAGDAEQQDYKLLLDIEGVEDFFGDMDFKVTGTNKGLTAIQFETKLQGVRPEIIKQAFRLSETGRMQVLDVMNQAIAASRLELAPNAPRVEIVQVPVDKIGEIIGPAGKVIKGLIAKAEELDPNKGTVEIDIQDDGRATVTANSKVQRDFVLGQIRMIIDGPEVGQIYEGPITKIAEFGAFVEIGGGIEGLLHISEIAVERVERVEDYLKVGQVVKVKLIEKKPGRYSLSIKQIEHPELAKPPREDRGDRGDRGGRGFGGGRGGDRGGRGFSERRGGFERRDR